jgi:hypothetical protein
MAHRLNLERAGEPAAVRQTMPSGEQAPSEVQRLMLVLGAPMVAVLAGLSAQWLDFQALRVPLLFMVGFGVLATAYAALGLSRGWRAFAAATLVGVATWAAAETVYAIVHVALGERFHAERFGPQWSQAIGLIAAHGIFLGAPTGVVAGAILQIAAWRRAR